MQRLAVSHHNIVRDVHDIVDGTQSNRAKLILKPLRTLFHIAARQSNANIARAEVWGVDADADGQRLVVHLELFAVRTMKTRLVTILNEPSIEIASHTIMAASICSVGSYVNLDEVIALDMIVLSCRSADLCVCGKNDDSAVVVANANLVFCTKHTATLNATKLATLDGKALIAIIKLGSNDGCNNLLTCSHIRSAADNLNGFAFSHVNCANVHVVAVWMRFASQHFSHIKTFQTAFYGLNFFYAIHLEACASKGIGNLLSTQRSIDIFLKPFV
jgi:hypothetical protein